MKFITSFTLLVCLFFVFKTNAQLPTATLNLSDFSIINRTTFDISQVESGASLQTRLYSYLGKNDYKPVGLRVAAGTVLTLNVNRLSGTALPKLVTFTRTYVDVTTYNLVQGNNTINISKAGNVYLQFSSSTPSIANKARVTFQTGAVQMPFYLMGITTNAQWQTTLNTDTISPDVTLLSNRAFIVLSREYAVASKTKNQNQLLANIDKIIEIESDISGLDGSAPQHKPFIHSQLMISDKSSGNPDATSFGRIRIPPSNISWITDPDFVLVNGGWGIMHEIGHHHQQSPYNISAAVNVEVLVNIHSLAAKRYFYPNAPGIDNEAWTVIAKYLDKDSINRNYEDSSVGFYLRLGMFQQLWLACGGDTFFKNFYKKIRIDRPTPGSNAEAQRKVLMVTASQIAGKNLNAFFKHWGINASQETVNAVNNLSLPNPEIEPSTFSESWVITKKTLMADTIITAGSNIAIRFGALAPTGVKKVAFYRNGTELLGETTTYPYEFNWQNIPRGNYSIHAKITAGDNTFQTTTPVNVFATGVSIAQPVNNASYFAGQSVSIVPSLVSASEVSKIEYYQGNTLIGESNAFPFAINWPSPANGVYSITANAFYTDATSQTSNPVSIAIGGVFASQDTYVWDGSNANFGGEQKMTVKADVSGYNRQAFMKFDLSKYTKAVNNAVLSLNISSAGSGVANTTWELYAVEDDTWDENTISWSNKPAGTLLLGTVAGKASGVASWVITDQVNAEIAGNKCLSLVLVSTVLNASANVSFHSNEATDISLRPMLDIDASMLQIRRKVSVTEDSFVRNGSYAAINYGTNQALVVKKDVNGFSRETYLKFDLSQYTKSLDSAALNINIANANNAIANTSWSLYYVPNDSWTEGSLNWNNKPTGTVFLGTVLGKTSGVASWDIVNQINSEIAGDKVLSLVLVSNVLNANAGVNFHSREAEDALKRPFIGVKFVIEDPGDIIATADAFVRDGSTANANFGNEPVLQVKKDIAYYNRETYLKFDLSAYNDNITNAALNLSIFETNNSVAATNWELYHVPNDSWTENTITWNNKPAGAVLLGTVAGKSTGTAVWDVSSLVNTEINGDKVLSLLVVGTVVNGLSNVSFHSKEAVNVAHRPILKINEPVAPLIASNNNLLLNSDNVSDIKTEMVVYPNPANQKVNVKSPSLIRSLKLVAIDGRTVLSKQQINTKDLELNLAHIHPGIYLINLQCEDGMVSQKLIVK